MYRRFYILSVIFCIMGKPLSASDIQLIQDTTKTGDNTLIEMPFNMIPKGIIASDVNTVNAPEILKYDIGAGILDLFQGQAPGLVGQNLRRLGNALIVIDGIPRDLSSVNVNEIEQITVLKDANAAVPYGVAAHNGIILIKTKRGKKGQNRISTTFEYGLGRPLGIPQYLGSADYMELYNEALRNEGGNNLYNETTIKNTKEGKFPARYPDMDFYSDEFLKDYKPYLKFVGDFSGGTDRVQYYLGWGWNRSGSLIKDRNPADNGRQHSDRLNIRSNIDVKINDYIRAYVDIGGVFNITNSMPRDLFTDAATIRPNAFTPLIDTALVKNRGIIKGASLIDGKYLLGGTTNYTNNPYGYLAMAGSTKQYNMGLQENTGIIFDLDMLLEGLSARANYSMDYTYRYNLAVTNQYAVYQPTWESDNVISNLNKIGEDKTTGTQNVVDPDIMRRMAIFATVDYRRIFDGDHSVYASLIAYADKFNETDVFQARRHAHLGSMVHYGYKNRYIINFNAAMPYSAKLHPDRRLAFSPTLALAWNISEEEFLKNNPAINQLMLRVSGGIIHTDENIQNTFIYEDMWGTTSQVGWNDGQRNNNAYHVRSPGNPLLYFEKRKDMNIGINTLLFNRSIAFNATYFQEYKMDLVTTFTNLKPAYLGGLNPYENWGEEKYSGLELGLGWNGSFGKWKFDINSSMLFASSEVIKRDELWGEDYLYRAGRPVFASFGYEALGFFKDPQDITNSPDQSSFGTAIRPGDIKYKDQNNDGIIDVNDQVQIALNDPTFVGTLPIRVQYDNFSLFVTGYWQTGASSFTQSNFYWIPGDGKYSVITKDRWTPETHAIATYPRLSSGTNHNNYQTSTFWMYDNSHFSINRVQLGYSVPQQFIESLHLKRFDLFVRMSNVAMFSKHREKMQLRVGSEPGYRYGTIGFTAQF